MKGHKEAEGHKKTGKIRKLNGYNQAERTLWELKKIKSC